MTTNYQKVIDELCHMYDIPTIQVRVVDKGTIGNARAEFNVVDGTYGITIVKGSSKNTIIHEWIHYCIYLIKKAEMLEEEICDWAPIGVRVSSTDTFPVLLSLLKKLPEEDDEVAEQ